MLLSRVTAHKINNFRCKYFATMAMSDDDHDDEDGATTTTTTMTMATARWAMGYNDDGGGRRRQKVDGNSVTATIMATLDNSQINSIVNLFTL